MCAREKNQTDKTPSRTCRANIRQGTGVLSVSPIEVQVTSEQRATVWKTLQSVITSMRVPSVHPPHKQLCVFRAE